MDDRFTEPRHLVDDPTFRQYVRSNDAGAVQHWTNWLARHPDQISIVSEATRLVQQLDAMPRYKLSNTEIATELSFIKARLRADPPARPVLVESAENPFRIGRTAYWVAAASLVLISAVSILFFNRSAQSTSESAPALRQKNPLAVARAPQPTIGYQTPFGKRQHIK